MKMTEKEHVIGPTRIGEMLLVDLQTARRVDPDSALFAVCQALSERGAAGVIEATFVVDLIEASPEDRAVLLDRGNWPVPDA